MEILLLNKHHLSCLFVVFNTGGGASAIRTKTARLLDITAHFEMI